MESYAASLMDPSHIKENFRIRFTLMTLLISTMMCLSFAAIFIYLKIYFAMALNLVFCTLYALFLILFIKRPTHWLRSGFVFALLTHMTCVAVLFSASSGFQFYLFIIPTLAGISLDITHKQQRWLGLLALILASGAFLYIVSFPSPPYVEVGGRWLNAFHFSSAILAMASLFAGFSFFANEVNNSKRQLTQMAISDPLTGALNRRGFFTRGDQEIYRCKRFGNTMALLIIDMDYFKKINDTHGHIAGDTVLKTTVAHIHNNIRKSDCVGRLGGEEFGLILPETQKESALEFANRLREEVSAINHPTDTGTIQITISIGMSVYSDDCHSMDNLFLEADKALYKAKNNGRNQVQTYSTSNR